jgi:DNA-binding transcriptional MerR regulator
MFKIGEFSKLSRVSVKTLRYYDDMGLLRPAHVDRFTGYRYYSVEQLPQLNRILALRDLGLSLEQVRQVLQDGLPAEQLRGMLRLKQAELEQHLADEEGRLRRVAARLKQIEQEGDMPTQEVVLKEVPVAIALRAPTVRSIFAMPPTTA